MSRTTEVEIGTEIGPYRVEQLLGRGGMACVYKVWHTGLHRYEALKLLSPNMTYDRVFIERFLMEARTAAGLSFPNIGLLYSVSTPDADVPYFTMELIEGGDLSKMLDSRGRLPLEEAIPLLKQIAVGLDYAHGKGVIHRDVKPANVLLAGGGPEPLIKIVDFGIARALESDATRLTKAGMIVGTPEYMSPEQGGSGAPMSERSDQYSLAVIAYEMLCGQTPFPARIFDSALAMLICQVREPPPHPLTLTPDLAPATVDALLKGLAKDPQERFENCMALVEALQSPVGAKGAKRKPAPVPVKTQTPAAYKAVPAPVAKKSSSMTAILAVVGVLIVVGTVAAGLMMTKQKGGTVTAPPKPVVNNVPPPTPPAGPTPQVRAAQEAASATKILAGIAAETSAFEKSNAENPWSDSRRTAKFKKLKEEAQDALDHSKAAVKLDPANVDGYITQVGALQWLNKKSEANQVKAAAKKLFPNSAALGALD